MRCFGRCRLAETLADWVDEFPAPLLKPLGLAELLGAIGPIVPPLVRIASTLPPVAASGLLLTMIGAITPTWPSTCCWPSWPAWSRGDDSAPTRSDHAFRRPRAERALIAELPAGDF
jgi:hypothetical protein